MPHFYRLPQDAETTILPRVRCGQRAWQANHRTGDLIFGLDIIDRAGPYCDGLGIRRTTAEYDQSHTCGVVSTTDMP